MPTLVPPAYAELDCVSNFSFLTGASHPEELVARAAELGYQALALSDECSLAGVVRAWSEAQRHDIKLIIGSRFAIGATEIILLARNLNGYGNLSELITLARRRSEKGQYQLSLRDITHPPPGHEHLQGMPDCLAIFKPAYGIEPHALQQQIPPLQDAFPGRLWLGLCLHHRHADAQHQATLEAAARFFRLKLLAAGHVEMHVRSRQPLHDTLAAIRLKQPLQQCGYALKPNAEHYLRSRFRLSNIYPAHALAETLFLSRLCSFDLKEIRYQYPREIVPQGMSPSSYLRQETFAGARKRYPGGISEPVRIQLESELTIISGLQYEPYFLTVYDIVRFAKLHGILCQGRGSAANSAVCYCLGITEVNPENGNALFARFISQARKEPPDIDVDFEHQRREEIIQYIYRKYGRDRAALTAVVTTYRTRSVLRDTGKALGLDPDLIDRVAKAFHYWGGKQSLLEKIAEHGLDADTHIAQLWAGLAQTLIGFPHHLSQHPGGFVIARDKLCRLVPIENAAMPDRSIVQWDKDDLDTMGLLKVDVLALGMLSALQRCLKMVACRRGRAFTLQDVPPDDKPTYDMIQRADTIGVFQIESRAQMSMLPRLKPATFYDLVIQIAIVRPGPIQGGMVHPYLRRRQKKEEVDSPTPEIAKVLERTLGVPIFQEQAMQIAMVAADFTADEADQLRRSMAAWRRKGGVDAFRDRLIHGMKAKGCPASFAERIYKQLEGFGEYGFPESHSASFAKLAYISAWLKHHEPEAFLAALLNSQPMGFYSPSQLVQDARRHQVAVLPIDVAVSPWEACLEARGTRPAVRLGLNQIKSLPKEAGLRIEAARQQRAFSSVHDLASRAGLNRHAMDALAAANALSSLAGHRRLARWQAASQTLPGLLRNTPIPDPVLPALPALTEGQSINADYQSMGLTLGRHPLALLRATLQARQFVQAATLSGSYPDRRLARACGIVTGRQRPQTANGTIFVTLEDETGNVNVIVHARLAERQRAVLVTAKLLGVYGVWQSHQGVTHLMASRLVDLSHLLGALPTRSRNFH
ncbi:error-prone DNA polymerase [Pusillimonas sp. SM2304]|uniref:error-prone DNA polymerase n=1 Tax=Pusillimonas sp. SM2304 TaxID=3073241 RepID=UPI002876F98A|nr:error-prone DNA polymerase [Pusillimonas sp. SM2304]MDS1141633.1 error-prone DNA polymerase [Pusillimonas sp. SM2304]